MNESKELLEATIKGLEDKLESVKSDLGKKVKELADVNKPVMTSEMYEKLQDLIHTACDETELDEDSFEYELSMEYDNKIEMQSIDFQDRETFAENIMNNIDSHYKIVEEEEE